MPVSRFFFSFSQTILQIMHAKNLHHINVLVANEKDVWTETAVDFGAEVNTLRSSAPTIKTGRFELVITNLNHLA